MKFKLIAGLALAALSVAANAQTFAYSIGLYLESYTNNNGDFEWNTKADFTGTNIYTYCFSTSDDIIGGENFFNVYSLAGTLTPAGIAALISNNNMAGLTPTSFLQAAALAEADGEPNSVASSDPWNGYNYDIHNVESGLSYTTTTDVSDVWYMQQVGGGQPQVYLGSRPPGAVPEPFTMTLGVAGVGLAMRRKLAKKTLSVA